MSDPQSTLHQPPATTRSLVGDPPYGELTVQGYAGLRGTVKTHHWNCSCSCGKTAVVSTTHLRSCHTTSCGHLRVKHSLSKHPLYNNWQIMLQRCHNPASDRYPRYGGRGIKVCAGWKESFTNFLADMGDRPTKRHTINRKDNDKGYLCGHCQECKESGEVANCEWATPREQANNTRRTIHLTVGDKTDSLQNWARTVGLSHITLRARLLDLGWTHAEAVTTPTGGVRGIYPVKDSSSPSSRESTPG